MKMLLYMHLSWKLFKKEQIDINLIRISDFLYFDSFLFINNYSICYFAFALLCVQAIKINACSIMTSDKIEIDAILIELNSSK